MNVEMAQSMAGGWWYPVVITAVALASSAHTYRSVRRLLTMPGGRVYPFGFRETAAVVLPLPCGIPLLYMPVLYGRMTGTPVALGSVGTGVAWGLGIVGMVGMLAAVARDHD
ncbi:hypothetical protein [Streptomyces lavendulae]